jgi:hypothetical protein
MLDDRDARGELVFMTGGADMKKIVINKSYDEFSVSYKAFVGVRTGLQRPGRGSRA